MARQHQHRGFTLVEVMIVVAMIGVLSTLAVYSVNKYILATKSSEAIELVQAMRAAQESYKDETFGYLNVNENLDQLYPMGTKSKLGDKKWSWGAGDAAIATKWRQLGVSANAPVMFGYSCIAGNGGSLPSGSVPASLNYPASPSGPWFVIRALADRNSNGVYATVIGSSFTDEIYSEDDTE